VSAGDRGSASGAAEFDYAPGQPNLYRMMRYKQELFATLGAEAGFAAFREKFGWPQQQRLGTLRIRSEREYAAAEGAFFRETAPAGERFVHEPPEVIGEGNHRPVHGTTRSDYVACLPSARVRGRSAAVVAGGQLLLDFQEGERDRLDDELEWDPSIFCVEDGCAGYIEGRDESQPLRLAEAFTLLGAHTDFFGHWMCEYLPKYTSAVLSGALPAVPVLIDAHMPASHRQSLELLFPERGPIIEVEAFRSVLVERLWIAPTPSYMPLHEKRNERFDWDVIAASPARLKPLMRELARRGQCSVPVPKQALRRVFLARKSFRHRKLVNTEAIEAEARQRGFEVVYPEDYPFAGQVGLLREARYIVALEGSATFLIPFAPAGAKVCVLSHPLTDALADFHEMFRANGIEMVVVTGPIASFNAQTPHDSDYAVDPAEFARFVDSWIQHDDGHDASKAAALPGRGG
jgi:capsular polysaccharide biosynthesis protein